MSCNYLKILKAAFISAAFLFNTQAFSAPSTSFESIKQKVTELLLQKKKSQAIQLVINYNKTDLARSHRADANDLLLKVAQQFISKDAQDAYENSLNLTLENPKEALKSNEQCLSADPQQLECLIQKVRLQVRNKSMKAATESIDEIKELVPSSKYENWLEILSIKGEAEFKNKQIIKNIPDKPSDENFGLLILELDRSFMAKNYSRAKDLIIYFEKNYSEWPDLVFYKHKLDSESAEEKTKPNVESNQHLTFYSNKCKSLSKTLSRKYRYDVELCARSLN
ncbi:hypothetical protein K2P97_01740 [bacterium]|nr:hypothetical protein [bacterium]